MFKDNLIERMKELDISARRLSIESGLAEGTIARYINGTREPRMEGVRKLAKALGVTPTYLTRDTSDSADALRTVVSMIEENRERWSDEEIRQIKDALSISKES